MERAPKYQPLSRDDDEDAGAQSSKESVNWNASSTDIIPTNTRSFVVFLCIIMISLSTNVLLVMDNARLRIMRDTGRSPYTGYNFDTLVPYRAMSEYWHPNASDHDMEKAWDAIDTSPMAIALDNEYVRRVDLEHSTQFPWDTDRSVYYLKGIHDLHCLKLVRKAIVSKHRGDEQKFNLRHIYHCLDGIRQGIMCAADDTPMPAPVAHHVGDGQIRQCRSWDRMVSWATRLDQHACYKFDDYREATNTLELFAFCPSGSPYRDFQQAYFEYHGHKDPYEPVPNETKDPVF